MSNLYIYTFLLLVSQAAAVLIWDSPQQNDAFLQLLETKPPAGINLFSHHNAVSNKVPDARGFAYEVTVIGGTIFTEPGGEFNAVNPVKSLYGALGQTWTFPSSTSPFTICWLARSDGDWESICSSSYEGVYVRDQQYDAAVTPTIDTGTANWIHSRYHWDQELSQAEMMEVTRALRKEIGGIPFAETEEVLPISDLRAYHFRLLLTLRPPQSINIFADFDGTTVPDRIGLFPAQLMSGTADIVTTTGNSWGADNTITSLLGSTTTKFLWPENSIPVIMTVCSVSRYPVGGTGVIFHCYESPTQPQNWFHGHYGNWRGVAYYLGWKTLISTYGAHDDWLVMCGSSSAVSPGQVVIDQMDRGTGIKTNAIGRLNTNYQAFRSSSFNVHSLYIWNTELSNTEMKTVSAALRAQIGGAPDIANHAKGDPVVAMAPAPTAYEQVCSAGTTSEIGDCAMCQVDTYSNGSACVSCPIGTTAPMDTGPIEDCVCLAGYTALSDGIECIPCVAGTWKGFTGSGVCSACPASTTSLEGSEICTCITGYVLA